MPYWPAKVIRTMPDGSYDVRFFGGYHQRALVEKPNIRPITTNIHTLQVKRTSLWNKASDELKKHQEFVAKVKSALPDFQKDLYGDPFIACEEIRDFIGNLEESDAENDENQDEADMEELGTPIKIIFNISSFSFFPFLTIVSIFRTNQICIGRRRRIK